jgi:diguanylate cyclase (GGDEF)-like protein
MAPPQRDESLAADWLRIRELSTNGKPEQALELAEQLIAEDRDPFQVAQALIARLLMLFNTANRDDLPSLLKPIEEQLHATGHPRLIGEYHVVAATIAHDRSSYGVALLHLVKAQRALERMGEHTRAAVHAWQDLATIYSRLGYHARAVHADDRAHSAAAEAGQSVALDGVSVAAVHAAVYLDQRGDTDGCVRRLTDLLERSRPYVGELSLIGRVSLSYAVRRLAALHRPIALDLPPVRDVGPVLHQVNTLGDVCDALAEERPEHALALLDAAPGPLDALGVTEPLRLRSLALTQLGDYAGALATERAMLRVTCHEERELRTLLADSTGARIDQEQLRQVAERHARAALTDELTGLPNRRKLDEFTAGLTAVGETAAIGVLDLDRFKVINDNHGHPTGDMVLQRVAGILAREVPPADLLARAGGDEFVVVLPGTSKSDAEMLGGRIEAAVRDEDWSAVVPDIAVGVSTGWAELDSDVGAAFRAADNALYETKRRHHAR